MPAFAELWKMWSSQCSFFRKLFFDHLSFVTGKELLSCAILERYLVKQGSLISCKCLSYIHMIFPKQTWNQSFPGAQCFSCAPQPTRWSQQPLAGGDTTVLGWMSLVEWNCSVELSSFPSEGTVGFLCQAASFHSSWTSYLWDLFCLSNSSWVNPKVLVLGEGLGCFQNEGKIVRTSIKMHCVSWKSRFVV